MREGNQENSLTGRPRYFIQKENDGSWAIGDRCGGFNELFVYPVQGIATLKDAKEQLEKLIRGEPHGDA